MSGHASRQRTTSWILAAVFLVFGLLCAIKVVYPLRYVEEIQHWASVHSLDPYLVAAVIRAESRFRPSACSHAGAMGLMQITPATGKWIAETLHHEGFTVENLYEPDLNIRFGTWYLRYLLDRLDEDVESCLIAYNAGPSNLKRWQSEGGTIFPETKDYVARVKRSWSAYRILYRLPLLGHLLKALPI